MAIFKLFFVIPAAIIFVSILSSFEESINKHIEIGTKNLYSISETFKTADLYVRELHKEHNERLNSAFR